MTTELTETAEPLTLDSRKNSARSLKIVAPHKAGRRIAFVLIGLVLLAAGILIWVPWQQTVIGYGQVIVYDAMNRPQEIEAQITGRLVKWNVQEGDDVKKGDVLAVLEDIDSKFLDPQQADRLTKQQEAITEQRSRVVSRADFLEKQIASVMASREAAISTAKQRILQSQQKLRAARQSVVSAQKSVEIAQNVGQASAKEKLAQTRDKVKQTEQALAAAKQDTETARLQQGRIKTLYDEGLRSRRDFELANNDLVKKQTDVERAELALKIARRDAAVGGFDQNKAGLDIDKSRTDLERARAAEQVAERDITTALLDLSKITSDTAASLDSLRGSLESARESTAKVDSDLQKIAIDQQNVKRRGEQQFVTAPRDGRVVRLLQVGAGSALKVGDVMATLVPQSDDRAVELMVTDNDVALLTPGRTVRLQIAGWPAVQFSGRPSVAVGTFGGIVSVIDAVDDGTARYRIIVKPDLARIASGKDTPWPPAQTLRPGAEATGWILLDEVPLGYELWRQFNGFPATVKRAPAGEKTKKDDGLKKDKKPFIKLKQPK